MKSLFLLSMLTFLFSLPGAAGSVELERDGERFELEVSLPGGAHFESDGFDRKFQVGEVRGSLRLAQDYYRHCATLVEERTANWSERGFHQIATAEGFDQCVVTLKNAITGDRSTSFYLFKPNCSCYAALHFHYHIDDVGEFSRIYEDIVADVSGNELAPYQASTYAQNTDQCVSGDPNCEYRSCPERRANHEFADPDEINYCGLPVRETIEEDVEADSWQEEIERLNSEIREMEEEFAQAEAEAERREMERLAEAGRTRLVFEIENGDPHDLQVSFYSQSRNAAWPGGTQIYVLPALETREFPLKCVEGEKICYGIWRENGDLTYWGKGRENKQACSNCCSLCGAGLHSVRLSEGPAPQFAQGGNNSGRGYGVGSVLNDLATGLAIGVSIGAAINASGPSAAPTGRGYGNSGISE